MRALAIDTSTSMAGIAVVDETGLLGTYMLNDKKTHSQKLLPMLKELLEGMKLTLEEIDILAAVTGPGSFTGLRIGVTTIKSMAYAAGKPVAGIPSLDALAETAAGAASSSPHVLICPIMDARNNQVFTAIYKLEHGVMLNVSGYQGMHISELASRIGEMGGNVLFTGDGVLLHRDFLKIELGDRASFMPDFLLQQMAPAAAQLALAKLQRGERMDAYELEPFYLRQSQAEREYDKKRTALDPEAL